MASIEFLRPQWLALLPLVPAIVGWLWYRMGRRSPWREHGDPALVNRVLRPVPGSGWLGWVLALLVGAIGLIALAGPSWERSLTSAMRPAHTRVIVLDLSRSMDATDAAPSRLGLAVNKARAILDRSRGVQVGVAVFAGASFLLAPLTSDANTLRHHLDVLDTTLIPVQGSRPDMGLQAAGELFYSGGALTGEVILISDGYRGERAAVEAAALREKGFPVSVIGVGTEAGAPIPMENGEHLRALNGEVISAPAYLPGLRVVAAAGGGRFAQAGPDDADVEHVLLSADLWASAVEDPDRLLSIPKDGGPWLVLLLVPFAALAFRRGWLLVLPLVIFAVPEPASAAWYDWFKGADFRAAQALRDADPARAVRLTRDPMLAGAAYYRLEQYELAAAAFNQGTSALAHYNRGNALAHLGRFRASVAAYDRALALDLGLNDARLNRTLIVALIEPEEAEDGARKDTSGQGGDASDDSNQSQARGESADSEERTDKDGETPKRKAAEVQAIEGYQSTLRPGGPVREIPEGGSEPWTTKRRLEWLAQIPDDPGSLLRQKFALEFQKRRWRSVHNTDAW